MKMSIAVTALVAVVLGAPSSWGADKGGPAVRQGTIFDDYDRPLPKSPPQGFAYVGVTAGAGVAHLDLEDLRDSDHSWLAGGYIGYWIRPANTFFGLGAEGDFAWQDFKFLRKAEDDVLSDRSRWTASARFRGGIYLTDNLIAYGTVGAGFTDVADPGPVYGGGLELSLSRVAIRAEVLRYDFSGDGADQTVGRVGLTFKLP